MGGKIRLASLLHEFIPATETFVVAEAIKRVFDKNGDRKKSTLRGCVFSSRKSAWKNFANYMKRKPPRCAPASRHRWNCGRCRSSPPPRRPAKSKTLPPNSSMVRAQCCAAEAAGIFSGANSADARRYSSHQNCRARGHFGGTRRQYSLGDTIAVCWVALDRGGGIAGGASEVGRARVGGTGTAGAAQSRRVRRSFDLSVGHLSSARTRQSHARRTFRECSRP